MLTRLTKQFATSHLLDRLLARPPLKEPFPRPQPSAGQLPALFPPSTRLLALTAQRYPCGFLALSDHPKASPPHTHPLSCPARVPSPLAGVALPVGGPPLPPSAPAPQPLPKSPTSSWPLPTISQPCLSADFAPHLLTPRGSLYSPPSSPPLPTPLPSGIGKRCLFPALRGGVLLPRL